MRISEGDVVGDFAFSQDVDKDLLRAYPKIVDISVISV
jgi:hypothetical protein